MNGEVWEVWSCVWGSEILKTWHFNLSLCFVLLPQNMSFQLLLLLLYQPLSAIMESHPLEPLYKLPSLWCFIRAIENSV